jgi:hypothetical protein
MQSRKFSCPLEELNSEYPITQPSAQSLISLRYTNVKLSPVRGLEWPRGFQEVKVPRFHDNGTGWW